MTNYPTFPRTYPEAALLPESCDSAAARYRYAPTMLFVPNCTLSTHGRKKNTCKKKEHTADDMACVCFVPESFYNGHDCSPLFLFYATVGSNRVLQWREEQTLRCVQTSYCGSSLAVVCGVCVSAGCSGSHIGCCSVLRVLPQIMREPETARRVTVYEHRLQAGAVCARPSV